MINEPGLSFEAKISFIRTFVIQAQEIPES